jgi:hypothetical protein
MGERVKSNWYVGRTYQDEVNWMKRWIKDRIAWIDSQMLPGPRATVKQAEAASGERLVTLDAPSGSTVYYTLDGSDPRLPGGAVSPKASVYSAPVPFRSNAQVFARAVQSEAWSCPTTVQ